MLNETILARQHQTMDPEGFQDDLYHQPEDQNLDIFLDPASKIQSWKYP